METTIPKQSARTIRKPPKKTRWVIKHQGEITEVKEIWNYSECHIGDTRGIVKTFTNASRLRLLKIMARVDWERVVPASLISLTYPDEHIQDIFDKRTEERHLFLRKLEKHIGRPITGIWRNEWEKRKSGARAGQYVPHIHILLFKCPYIPWQAIRQFWRAILHVKGPLCTDVRRAKEANKAAYYVAKYLGKASDDTSLDNAAYLNSRGRHWGIHRKEGIPWHSKEVIKNLSQDQINLIKQIGSQLIHGYSSVLGTSFTVLGHNSEIFWQALQEIGIA